MEADTPNIHTPPEGHAPTPPPDPQQKHENLQGDLDQVFEEQPPAKKVI